MLTTSVLCELRMTGGTEALGNNLLTVCVSVPFSLKYTAFKMNDVEKVVIVK